jgi:hypothetical protein
LWLFIEGDEDAVRRTVPPRFADDISRECQPQSMLVRNAGGSNDQVRLILDRRFVNLGGQQSITIRLQITRTQISTSPIARAYSFSDVRAPFVGIYIGEVLGSSGGSTFCDGSVIFVPLTL